jgi:hypothetical protein
MQGAIDFGDATLNRRTLSIQFTLVRLIAGDERDERLGKGRALRAIGCDLFHGGALVKCGLQVFGSEDDQA